MLFSSKISNSLLTFLERGGANLDPFFEQTNLPTEFLRDPSYWIKADEMESLISTAEQLFDEDLGGGQLIAKVGHECSDLKAWGVLDSVLKMMDSSGEIYSQPDRFLSYFISPPPPIGNVQKTETSVSFQVPLSPSTHPKTYAFLTAALEGLPKFFDENISEVNWSDTSVDVKWEVPQESLFKDQDPGRNMSPQFVQDIVRTMEENQRNLEAKNKELLLKNQELEAAKQALETHMQEKIYSEKLSGLSELAAGVAHEVNSPISYVMSNVRRLQDYMVRAQQLITLLVAQGRMDKQVQKAMQKVDWDYIQGEFPLAVNDSIQGLNRIQEIVKDLSFLADSGKLNQGQKTSSSLNTLVDNAIKTIQPQIPQKVRVDRHLLFEQSVEVDPVRIEQALINFINNAVQSIDGEGAVRVVTRPKGSRAEIEISDTGTGMDDETLKNIFTPFFTTKQAGRGTGLGLSIAHSIVKMHEGSITVNSQKGRGSTFLIELPQ